VTDLLRAALAPHAYYKSDVRLVVLENTHNLGGGTVQSLAEQRDVIAAARECDFRVHLDGARIWNAAIALGVAPAELAAGAPRPAA
jgi:threonine aldolase